MNLEFKVVKLKENSISLRSLKKAFTRLPNPRNKFSNEFIIVGEKEGSLKLLELNEEGITLIADFLLDYITYEIPKEEIIWDGTLYTEIDIPKNRLNVDIIENIIRLNSTKLVGAEKVG